MTIGSTRKTKSHAAVYNEVKENLLLLNMAADLINKTKNALNGTRDAVQYENTLDGRVVRASRSGVSNPWPAGHMWPAGRFRNYQYYQLNCYLIYGELTFREIIVI